MSVRSPHPHTWVTRDGQRIHVSRMESSHLINTAKFLLRTCIKQHAYMGKLMIFTPDFHGDMAQESFDQAFDEYLESTPYDFLPEIYHRIIAEIEKRKLDFDEMDYYETAITAGDAL